MFFHPLVSFTLLAVDHRSWQTGVSGQAVNKTGVSRRLSIEALLDIDVLGLFGTFQVLANPNR